MDVDGGRSERAKQRAEWVGRKTTLGGQDDATVVRHGTPGERIEMLWQVTWDAWVSSGRPLPNYTRAEMPGRLIRLEDDR